MRRTIAIALISAWMAGAAAGCSVAASGSPHSSSSPGGSSPGGSSPGGSSQGGSSQGGSSPASGAGQAMTVMRQLAHCIRSHGMPGWPDPVINPLTSSPDWPPNAPRVPASILQACQSIANRLPPDVQDSQPPTPASMQALLRYARCMRSHGIPGWPDPNALGEFPLTTQMAAQVKGPVDRRASSACIRYVPGGTQYLQFVEAAAAQPGQGGAGNG
jgi:hypothetical protein